MVLVPSRRGPSSLGPNSLAAEPAGPHAEEIDQLWQLMLWLGVAVFLLVAALLAWGLWRQPKDRDAAELRVTGRWLVAGGVVLPTVLLVVVFGATVATMRELPARGGDDAEVVEIVGHQWWFEVHYPERGVTTRNELHIPVGRPVELRLTSADVIHSFWVPELGGKRDMLPRDTNVLVVQADEPGDYVSRCAEFCGLHHAQMTLEVVAEPEDEYVEWVEAAAR